MRQLRITRDTFRGLNKDRPVKAGTLVTVKAVREDADGIKLLVALGKGYGGAFQVEANDTDYAH